MKVRVTDLPPEGLKINDTIPLEPLNARMAEGTSADIKFTEAPRVEITVLPTHGGGAETKGKVRSKYLQPCGRCLEVLEREIEAEANFAFMPRPAVPPGEDPNPQDEEQLIDDVGLVYFEGDQVEIEELLQEALILGLSAFWSPPCDEKGNCKLCGFNIDKFIDKPGTVKETGSVRFGDLLSAAQEKKKKRGKKKVH